MKEILNLKPCGCGRSWCDFFNPSEGEWGTSYSREEVEGILSLLPEIKAHLEKILNEKDHE